MKENKLMIPIAIVIAALIIAGAVIFSNNKGPAAPQAGQPNQPEVPGEVSVNPVSEADHILGNPDADILVIEYSDFECPFCGKFHPTMERVMDEYGDDGKVAWVFRHFPLDQIHPKARAAAEASECVADLEGNQVFWDYSKVLFENSQSLSDEVLKTAAIDLGVDAAKYQSCVDSGKFEVEVQNDFEDGLGIAQTDPRFGTPYSVILHKSGAQASIAGAQEYDVVKQIIDAMLEAEL